MTSQLEWAPATGRGQLVSWSVVHARLGGPVAIPAQVRLDEGPWLSTTLHLPGSAPGPGPGPGPDQDPTCLTSLTRLADLRAGLPVAVEFVHPAAGESYPLFRPVGSHG